MKNFTDLTGKKAIVTGAVQVPKARRSEWAGRGMQVNALAPEVSDYLNGAIIPVDGGYLVR